MRLVKNLNEIQSNMDTLDRYLTRKTESTYSFALDRVNRGTCFIAQRTDSGYRFYPSRFVGYANNSMLEHLNNPNKDGRKTNSAICQIIGCKPSTNPVLDQEYRKYCERLGFIANDTGSYKVERKYWEL